MNLANHLWQSTLFAALTALLAWTLRNHRARVRHALWLAASIKFLAPLSVLMALGGAIEWRTVPVAGQSAALAVDAVTRPFAVAAAAVPTRAPAANPLPAILWCLWGCGFAGITVSWLVRWRRLRAAVRGGTALDLGLPIRAVCAAGAMEPGVFGVFSPVLVLPEAIFEKLTPEQLRAVIAHELCHVRHRDNLIAALHMAVETVFWFHPLVWWIGKQMVAEREAACDEEVVRLGSEPRTYAEGILNVCKLYVESPLPCASGVTGADLKRRIATIMSRRKALSLRLWHKIALAGCGLAAVAAPFLLGVLHAPAARAQAANANQPRPEFEVASIKPSAGGPGSFIGTERNGVFNAKNMPLLGIISQAYGVQGFQIYGAPSWTRSETFDIVAKPEVSEGAGPSKETSAARWANLLLRLQGLLESRCSLKVHRETKELPVLDLVVAKGGLKLLPSECLVFDPQNPPPNPPSGENPKFCGNLGQHRQGELSGYGNEMATFVQWLARQTNRTVIDKTGYAAKFNVKLEWTPEILAGGPNAEGKGENPAPGANGPSLFTALQEQMGLKLENSKGPVEVLVIDHVDRPTGN